MTKRILQPGDTIVVKLCGKTEVGKATALINRGKALVVTLSNGMKMKVSTASGWRWATQ